MTLDDIPYFIASGFPGLWVVTSEPECAQAAIVRLCEERAINAAHAAWDCARGLVELQAATDTHDSRTCQPAYPLSAAVAATRQRHQSKGEDDQPTPRRVIYLWAYHRFCDHPAIAQALYNALVAGESSGTHYIVLSSATTAGLPGELQKCFTLFDHPLPDAGEIAATANQLLPSLPPPVDQAVVDACKGLNRRELRNALALSIYRHDAYLPALLSDLKAQEVSKGGVLTLLCPPDGGFKGLAGMAGAKDLLARLCAPNPLGLHAKGVLLIGPPGTGKSALACAAAAEVGRPLLRLDVGALMSRYVGASEENLRAALATIEATAPNVVQVEEIEKAFAGVGGEGGDRGVARRMFGHLLTWMAERDGPSLILATSNDVRSLPPEFLRAGRWSAEVFVDLPTPAERAGIWQIYLDKYRLPPGANAQVDDADWTGGEIRQACELAVLLGTSVPDAARKVRITARTRRQQIADLRQYAADAGVLSAATGEPYTLPQTPVAKSDAKPAARSITAKKTPH